MKILSPEIQEFKGQNLLEIKKLEVNLAKRSNYSEILLKNFEARQLLKQMILKKAEHYQQILQKRKEFLVSNVFPERTGEARSYFLEMVFDMEMEGQELPIIERDLTNMCYDLIRAEGKLQNISWNKAYEYAVYEIGIEKVITSFLGNFNVNKNIACPFHEDKKPSFKVYINRNRFICFSCGVRGSPVDFVMQYKNCSFRDAVLYISNL